MHAGSLLVFMSCVLFVVRWNTLNGKAGALGRDLREGVGVERHTPHPRATLASRIFITLMLFIIVMSPEFQEFVIMDTLSLMTVAALMIIKMINRLEKHHQWMILSRAHAGQIVKRSHEYRDLMQQSPP